MKQRKKRISTDGGLRIMGTRTGILMAAYEEQTDFG